jgi:hypothetical protein
VGDRCYDSCPINYFNNTGQSGPDIICVPEECSNRVQYENKSCSVREDFANINDILKCYSYETGCRQESECPFNTQRVLNIYYLLVYYCYLHFFFFFIDIIIVIIMSFFLFCFRIIMKELSLEMLGGIAVISLWCVF